MTIEIREVTTQCDFKAFAKLPFSIYKGNKFWVPSLIKDDIKSIRPETNPAYDFCRAKFWLAYKEGKCVGRIGGIINEKYNEKTAEKIARFSRAEFINDNEVVDKLFETAENWAKTEGMTGIQGPLGFSNLDTQGLLVEGYDHLPSIASVYHLPYYKEQIERVGYEKEIDWLEFRLTIEATPEKAAKMAELIKNRYKLEVVHFNSSKEMQPYAYKIFDLLNTAFDELFSVVHFDKKMIAYYTDKYFKFLNPKFVKVILNEEKTIVGFIIGVPSLSEAMQKANGKLFPFGFWHLMKAMKHPKVVDLFLTAVDPKLQSQGVAAILINELQKVLIEHQVAYVETTGMFETNHKAIQNWKNYNHIQHKRKRCFRKVF